MTCHERAGWLPWVPKNPYNLVWLLYCVHTVSDLYQHLANTGQSVCSLLSCLCVTFMSSPDSDIKMVHLFFYWSASHFPSYTCSMLFRWLEHHDVMFSWSTNMSAFRHIITLPCRSQVLECDAIPNPKSCIGASETTCSWEQLDVQIYYFTEPKPLTMQNNFTFPTYKLCNLE